MPSVGDHYPSRSVGIDFDGTLNHDSRDLYPGPPRGDIVHLVRRLHDAGWWVVIFSSRSNTHFAVVSTWLSTFKVPYSQITLGAKPPCDVYVDDKGLMIPLHALEEHVWLSSGAATPQQQWASGSPVTAYRRDMADFSENPAWSGNDDAPGLRVVVPVTGGLDSSTLWAMAQEHGYPAEAVYLDCGSAYTNEEIKRADQLTGGQVTLVPSPTVTYTQVAHVQPGRNAIIIRTLADWATSQGWWGEIWFGNHGDETKNRGGDKSFRFLTSSQHLLTAAGLDFRLASPLAGLTKPDLVRWWASRNRLNEALNTYTCFTGAPHHCGRCWACMQRALAFTVAGYRDEVVATFPDGIDFTVPAATYWNKRDARRRADMRGGRAEGTDEAMIELGYGHE